LWSTAATRVTTVPAKRRRAPSPIHSMVMMWRLSSLMGLKPAVTLAVGMRWATPQAAAVAPPRYNSTRFYRWASSGEFEEQVLDVVEAVAVGG
jgi:hypothetical protein